MRSYHRFTETRVTTRTIWILRFLGWPQYKTVVGFQTPHGTMSTTIYHDDESGPPHA